MGLFDIFKAKKSTAETAKNRLQIIIAQERSTRGGPDYLPLLQRELLEVIKKYVNIDADAVKVDLVKDGEHDVLDISVALPEGPQGCSKATRRRHSRTPGWTTTTTTSTPRRTITTRSSTPASTRTGWTRSNTCATPG